jgi:peptidyl-dipeptidase Dcp
VSNPFLAPSPLPFELPPFAEIREEHYGPAIDEGMRQQLAEVRAVADDPEPPTFANTFLPLERSGALLDRVWRAFDAVHSAHTSPGLEALDSEYSPRLAAHRDAIALDPDLYARVRAVHDDTEQMAALDPESRRLVARTLTELTVAGAGLDEDAKVRLRELNERLATLSSAFQSELLASSNAGAVHVSDPDRLAGLDDGQLATAAAAAADAGLDGHLITLVNTSSHPWLADLTDRDLRRELQRAQVSKGQGEHDTLGTVRELTALRAERAALFDRPSHASVRLLDTMAGSAEAVAGLLSRLAPPAARNARAEQEALEAELGQPIEAHDWAFAAARVRASRYDVDLGALRPWFEAERVLRDGIFFAAERLFGLTFTERPDLAGWHPDMRTFEVREEDGTPIGLFLLDLYARPTKRGGAWMNELVSQSTLLDRPYAVVTNNLNVPKPPEGRPTLLTFDEVTTFFHEFGHALHGLLARVTYPHFSGTNVFIDFVEYPSQVNEMWMLWPEVLANYARHHETGEPLPQEVVDRLLAARSFGEGFATSEYLGAALLDQAWHAIPAGDAVEDPLAFEANALAAVGLDNPAVPPRYRTSYFMHAFSPEYDAQYYVYIWSEVLDADTVAWFEENGGLTRENGERYREFVVGIGGARDPLESYREFRGAEPDIAHLLRRRGLD